jgi:hypothetical protein
MSQVSFLKIRSTHGNAKAWINGVYGFPHLNSVVGWIRNRIRMFLCLPDPDNLVRGTDTDPDPSVIKQK